MTGAPALEVSDLSVAYDGRSVLDNVALTVWPGDLAAVIGPNGAGKSTLFRALCGLVPHTGTVAIGGAHCHHQRDRAPVAYLPQRADLDLDFPITVAQAVLSGRRRFLRAGQRPALAHRAAAAEAQRIVGLAGYGNRPIGSLSGGETQRVFIARALCQEARVILLDESMSGVDSPTTEALLDLFHALRATGVALLVATHDLALARRRFERCIALNRRVVADGPPAGALDPVHTEATFGSGRVPELL